MVAVVGLQPLQRAGALERAQDAVTQAVSLRDAFGPPAAMMASAAFGLTARDRGSWAEAMDHLSAAVGAADARGLTLSSLVLRLELVLTSAILGTDSPDSPDAPEVAQLADAAGTPAIVSAAHSAMALVGVGPLPETPPATVQETAMRADAIALRVVGSTRRTWPLGVTQPPSGHGSGTKSSSPARQARCGDRPAAEKTFDAIGADDERRSWPLQR